MSQGQQISLEDRPSSLDEFMFFTLHIESTVFPSRCATKSQLWPPERCVAKGKILFCLSYVLWWNQWVGKSGCSLSEGDPYFWDLIKFASHWQTILPSEEASFCSLLPKNLNNTRNSQNLSFMWWCSKHLKAWSLPGLVTRCTFADSSPKATTIRALRKCPKDQRK